MSADMDRALDNLRAELLPDSSTPEGRAANMRRFGEFVGELLLDQPEVHPSLMKSLIIREARRLRLGVWPPKSGKV